MSILPWVGSAHLVYWDHKLFTSRNILSSTAKNWFYHSCWTVRVMSNLSWWVLISIGICCIRSVFLLAIKSHRLLVLLLLSIQVSLHIDHILETIDNFKRDSYLVQNISLLDFKLLYATWKLFSLHYKVIFISLVLFKLILNHVFESLERIINRLLALNLGLFELFFKLTNDVVVSGTLISQLFEILLGYLFDSY